MSSRIEILRWPAGITIASLLAVAIALVSQHVFEIQPCPWCVLQRLVFVVIAILGAIALFVTRRVPGVVTGALILIMALLGAAAACWQHFVAAKSASCNLTLADEIMREALHLDRLLPSVFDARASCADAAVNLLGIPYEFWSLGLFALIGVASIRFMGLMLRQG